MSITSKAKIGALHTGEFAVDVALNVGIIGCQGVRLTGTGIRKFGETLEVIGFVGESAMQARMAEIHAGTERLVQMVKDLEANSKANADDAEPEGGPEVVMT